MTLFKINKITVNGFISYPYGKKQELVVNSGTTLITGPNGSGKSSLLDSILFAFYGPNAISGVNKSELFNLKSAKIDARIEFTLQNEHYETRREYNRSGGGDAKLLKLIAEDGELKRKPVVQGLDDVTDSMKDLLQMDDKQFKNLLYSSQGELTEILSGNVRDLLTRFFKLKKYSTAGQNMANLLSKIEDKITDLKLGIAEIKSTPEELNEIEKKLSENKRKRREELDDYQDNKSDLLDLKKEVEKLDLLKENISKINSAINTIEGQISGYKEEISSLMEEIKIDIEVEDIEKLDKTIEEQEEKFRQLEKDVEKLSKIHELIEKMETLDEELEGLKGQIDTKIAEIKNKINELHANLLFDDTKDNIEELLKEFEISEERVKELNKQKNEIYQKYVNAKTKYENHIKSVNDQQEAIEQKNLEINKIIPKGISIDQVKEYIEEQLQELEKAKEELKEFKNTLDNEKTKLEIMKSKVKDLKSSIDMAELTETGTCKYCGSELTGDSLKQHLEEKNTELKQLKSKKETLAKKINELSKDFDQKDKDLQNREERLNELNTLYQELTKMVEEIQDLKDQKEELNDSKESAKEEFEQKENEYEDANQQREDYKNLEIIKSKIENRNVTKKQYDQKIKEKKEIETDLEKFEIDELSDNEIAELIERKKEELISQESLIDDLRKIKSKIEEIINRKEEIAQIKDELKEVSKDYDEEDHNDKSNKVQDFKDKLTKAVNNFKHLATEHFDAIVLKIKLENQLKKLKRLQDEKDKIEHIKVFVTKLRSTIQRLPEIIINHKKDEISIKATQKMNEIYPSNDISSLTIEKKKHGERTTFEYYVTKSFGKLPISSVSGGQAVAAALALRFALSEILSPYNVLMLDEPTIHLDNTKVEDLVGLFENQNPYDQLILVSHRQEFSRIADEVVPIELKRGDSIIHQGGSS